jgi:hypothetical protein
MSDSTDIHAMLPARHMRAIDIVGDTLATIVGVEQQEVGADGDIKPCLVFREPHLRPLPVNRTNADSLTEALGTSDTRRWIGRQVVLYASETRYQGRRVPCVRIRDTAPASQRQAQPALGDGRGRPVDHQRPLDREPGEDDGPAPGWDRLPPAA